jgi:hypothetical protein
VAEILINMEGFKRALIRQATPIIEGYVNELVSIFPEQADDPKTGRNYRLPQGGSYRASAPGESPARRTGNLLDSIVTPGVREESGAVVGEIRIRARHAILLERGTPRISRRPLVQPAIEEFLRRQA